MDISTRAKLNNGTKIPMLGLGTWELTGNTEEAVLNALKLGYRHVDTAMVYGNEKEIGRAIRKSGIPRKELFITTKLWNNDHSNPAMAFNDSLRRLGLDYVDLYLIHWPVPQRNRSWKELDKFQKDGRAKAIGVSNFTIRHLKQLLEESNVVPAVNQVEFSTFLYQKELLEFCKSNGIQLEAYSPLARANKFDNTALIRIARNHGKSPAQVMIRWVLQHGVVAIPKSGNKQRQRQNADVFGFELSAGDMKALDALDEGFRCCPDPSQMP